MMFAQTAWFQLTPTRRRQRLYLRPVSWQGRLYTAAWATVIAMPSLALFSRGQLPELLLWLAASIGTLLWDLHPVRSQLKTPTPTPAPVDDSAERLAHRHSHHCRDRRG